VKREEPMHRVDRGFVRRTGAGRAGWPAVAAWTVAMLALTANAEARPRGPVMRAERRLARAEAGLDREEARTRAAQRAGEVRREAEAARPAPATPRPATAARPALPPSRPRAAEPTPAQVAPAAFEDPVPPGPARAAPSVTRPGEPAEDGTYSVLVRPEAAAQPAPLAFPDASTP